MHRPTARLALSLALVACVAAPVRAQDDPAPGNVPEQEQTSGEKERKIVKTALAALEGWGKAMHLPQATKADRIVARAAAANQSMFQGGDLDVTLTWERGSGLSIGVELPPEMTQSLPPEAVEMAKGMFTRWSREALAPAFEAPEQYAGSYHVGERKEGERSVVELLPFDDKAAAELQLLYFDENGLCERRILIPRVDPDDPAQQMMVGVEVETSFGYEKVGERHVLKRMSMLLPWGEMLAEYDYYEVTDGPPLLKSVTMATPFAADPIEVTLRDYEMDGEPVASTSAKDDDDDTEETPDDDGKSGAD